MYGDDILRAIAAIGGSLAAMFTYLNNRHMKPSNGTAASQRAREKRWRKGKPSVGDAVTMILERIDGAVQETSTERRELLEAVQRIETKLA